MSKILAHALLCALAAWDAAASALSGVQAGQQPMPAFVWDTRVVAQLVAGGEEGPVDCADSGSQALHLVDPIDIAPAPGGLVYVLDHACHRVISAPLSGAGAGGGGPIMASLGAGGMPENLHNAHALHVDPDSGVLYIADTVNQRIVRYNAPGVMFAEVVLRGNAGTDNGDIYDPVGVFVRDGTIYVVEGTNNRVQEFVEATCCADPNHPVGMVIFGCPELVPPAPPPSICDRGWDLARLRFPAHLFVTSDLEFFVADTLNHRVVRFHINDTRSNPEHDFSNYTVAASVVAGTSGIPGCQPEQLRSPTGVVVDSDGYLYVGDTGNHRVQKFAVASGERVAVTVAGECCCPRAGAGGLPVGGADLHQLDGPHGLAIDPASGALLVVDRGNRRILRIGPDSGAHEVPRAPAASCAFGVHCTVRLHSFLRPGQADQLLIARRGAYSGSPGSPCGDFNCSIPSWPGVANPSVAGGPFGDAYALGVPGGPPDNATSGLGEYALCLARAPTLPCVSRACRGEDNCTNSSSWLCSGDTAPFGLRRKAWFGVPGEDLASLRQWHAFPDEPDVEEAVSVFGTDPNIGDNYGQQIYGLFVAPETGTYFFHVTSDEHSELRLSDTFNDTSGQVLAYISESQVWFNVAIDQDPHYGFARGPSDWTSFATQTGAVDLEAGQLYWVEVLHKEGTGVDHLGVGVTLPNGTEYKPMPAAFFYGVACGTDGLPAGLGVTHDCYGKTTGETCIAECRGGFAGTHQTFYCDGLGRFIGADPVCEAVNCEEYDVEVGSFFMHGIVGLVDCSNMDEGDDCSAALGDWAGAGNCVAHVNTNGKTCHDYCTFRGRSCVKGMDDNGQTCGLYPGGHSRQTTAQGGCLQSWGDQICVCGRQETTGKFCLFPEYCEPGLMYPAGRPLGAHEDSQGYLVVADTWRHMVVRWRAYMPEILAGGNLAGDNASQLERPQGVWFVGGASGDDGGTGAAGAALYVADTVNHRIMRYGLGNDSSIFDPGEVVFGTGAPGRNLTECRYPIGVYVDGNNTLFVADYGNARVLRVLDGQDEGEVVSAAEAMSLPILPTSAADTFFDSLGNYYYVDYAAHRLSVCYRTLHCDLRACMDVVFGADYGPSCGCIGYTTQCADANGALPGSHVVPSDIRPPPAILYA